MSLFITVLKLRDIVTKDNPNNDDYFSVFNVFVLMSFVYNCVKDFSMNWEK